MRAGKIVGLRPIDVDTAKRVAHLPETKTGTSRNVPLSKEAIRLLSLLPENDPVFGLTSASLSTPWRKLRDRAGVSGLTFHDSRASAITRLSKKVDVLDLARIVGHKNIAELMTYYRDSPEEIASRLD
ncbi:MAG: site-specific integrase [Yoonia sp.]|uniref:site-specific integrase n=1 Tax=Yoonia sp. TaxID=2212373 RepID=UPI003274CDD7